MVPTRVFFRAVARDRHPTSACPALHIARGGPVASPNVVPTFRSAPGYWTIQGCEKRDKRRLIRHDRYNAPRFPSVIAVPFHTLKYLLWHRLPTFPQPRRIASAYVTARFQS